MENKTQISMNQGSGNVLVWVVMVVAAGLLVWWVFNFYTQPSGAPRKAASETSSDLEGLNNLDVDVNLDSEFQGIDGELNNL